MQAPEIQALGDILQALLGNVGKMSEAQKYNTQMQYEGAREDKRQQFEIDMMGEEQKFKKESPEWELAQNQLEEVTIPEVVKKVLNITDRNTVPRYELENLMDLYYAEESNRLRGEEIAQKGELTPGEQQHADLMEQVGKVSNFYNDYDFNTIDSQEDYNFVEAGEGGGVEFTDQLREYYNPITMGAFLDDYQAEFGDIDPKYIPGIEEVLGDKFKGQRKEKMQTLYNSVWQELVNERVGDISALHFSDYLTYSGFPDMSKLLQDVNEPGASLLDLKLGKAPGLEKKNPRSDEALDNPYYQEKRFIKQLLNAQQSLGDGLPMIGF